jgi:hypothetical protein
MPQRVIRDAWPLDVGRPQVAVDDVANTAAAQPVPGRMVADGGQQWLAQAVARKRSTARARLAEPYTGTRVL